MPMPAKLNLRPLDRYDMDTMTFIREFEDYVTEHFGERCLTIDEDCPCCNMWGHYDSVRELTDVDG